MRKNVRLLEVIGFLQGMVFYASIAALYRRACGLTVFQITLIEGVSAAAAMLLELPWGRLAERIGYRRAMILSNGLYFASKLVFWRAESFAAFLLERLILAAALAGLSGVDMSVLYLSDEKEKAQHNAGVYTACGQAGLLLSGAVYALLPEGAYRLSALMTAAVYGAAWALTFRLKEVRPPEAGPEERASLKTLLRHFAVPGMACLAISGAVFGEGCRCAAVWLAQLQYARCGLPARAFGAAFVLASAASLLSPLSDRVTKGAGRRKTGLLLMLCGGACALALARTDSAWLSAGLVAALSGTHALLSPLLAAEIGDRVRTADRATALSLNALLEDTALMAVQPALGRAADHSLPLAFALISGCCLAAAALYLSAFSGRART